VTLVMFKSVCLIVMPTQTDRMFTPDERGRLGVRPCLSWRVLGMANYKSHTTVSRNGNSVDLVDCFHRDGRIWCLVDDFEFGGGA